MPAEGHFCDWCESAQQEYAFFTGSEEGCLRLAQLVSGALHPTDVGELVERQNAGRAARERLVCRERIDDGECSACGHALASCCASQRRVWP